MIHCTLGNVQKPVSASFWEQSPWMKSPTILASSSYYGLIPSINLKSFSETKTWSCKPDSGCSYKPGYSCVLYLETMRKRVRCQKGCRRGNVNVNVNWNHVKHNCCEVNSVQLLRHNIRWNRLLVVEDTQKECKTSSRSWSLDSVCNFGHRGWFSWFKFS